jgi:hypothetical protein
LEVRLREAKAGGEELKRAMKEASDSEYAVSQKSWLMRQELVGALRSSSRLS